MTKLLHTSLPLHLSYDSHPCNKWIRSEGKRWENDRQVSNQLSWWKKLCSSQTGVTCINRQSVKSLDLESSSFSPMSPLCLEERRPSRKRGLFLINVLSRIFRSVNVTVVSTLIFFFFSSSRLLISFLHLLFLHKTQKESFLNCFISSSSSSLPLFPWVKHHS